MQRNTLQRNLILKVIKDLKHSTLQDIIDHVKFKSNNISVATIYRNLEVLEDEGLIRKIPTKFKASIYEDAKLKNHDHFICEECFKIKDLVKDNDKINYLNEDGDLYLSEIKVYYGVCKDCLKHRGC